MQAVLTDPGAHQTAVTDHAECPRCSYVRTIRATAAELDGAHAHRSGTCRTELTWRQVTVGIRACLRPPPRRRRPSTRRCSGRCHDRRSRWSHHQPRSASLLPPVHIAVVNAERMLSGLDELLETLPLPAEQSSSMVLITGPSRTADIEQTLVRGVHGPGEIHVVILS